MEVINYSITAEIVDIQKDTPQASESFIVDSNVWYWMTYSRASQGDTPPKGYQLKYYPDYINRALGTDAVLLRCSLSLAELIHRIEATEREIFAKNTGNIGGKIYRHNYPHARKEMVEEVQTAWGQVKSISTRSLEVVIDDSAENTALKRFQEEKVDGYDLFILEAMKKEGIIQIITDDCDFATVAGIRVFTANRNVITAAQQQNKLLKR